MNYRTINIESTVASTNKNTDKSTIHYHDLDVFYLKKGHLVQFTKLNSDESEIGE